MDLDDLKFYRWYGPWEPLTPDGVAKLLSGFDRPWWIVGGWAIEAYTGRSREHEDIDVALFRSDLPALLSHLLPSTYENPDAPDGVCVWSILRGVLRPLRTPEDLPDECRQLWIRRDGGSPWLSDVLLTPSESPDAWVSVRDSSIRLPFSRATFVASDGIRYLAPEVALHLKARLARPKDDEDIAAVLPLLDATSRGWLREVVAAERADHPWLSFL